MIFTDPELKILAEVLAKHTGEQFDLSAEDARAVVGSAFIAIEDPKVLGEIDQELEARGVRIEEAEEPAPAKPRPVTVSEAARDLMLDDLPSRGASKSVQERIRQMRKVSSDPAFAGRQPLFSPEFETAFAHNLGAALDELRGSSELPDLWHRLSSAFRALWGSAPVYMVIPDTTATPTLKIVTTRQMGDSVVLISPDAKVVSKELTQATGSASQARAIVESLLKQFAGPQQPRTSAHSDRAAY